jgi:hypothetical protein
MSQLFDLMAGTQQGNQMAQSAMRGILPNASQPKGAPQFYMPVIGALQTQIAGLNRIADEIRRLGGDTSSEYVLDIIDVTKTLQGMVVDMQKEIQEMQANGPQQAAA